MNDKMVPGAIDGSEDISHDLPFPIPFYQNMESKLFVSSSSHSESFESQLLHFIIGFN